MKPKKLIRNGSWTENFKDEIEVVTDKDELNRLFVLKIKEELQEIVNSDFKDIYEFVDLMDACKAFISNNFDSEEFLYHSMEKHLKKGFFSNIVLNNLNSSNESNRIYFDEV